MEYLNQYSEYDVQVNGEEDLEEQDHIQSDEGKGARGPIGS
jgi:hypothetical protein